jgi:CubicO group peptidase (beta-lactamase class C family)
MTLSHALTQHIDSAIASGREAGIQLCVYQHGQMIIDITRGTRDDHGTLLHPNDLVLVWSTSKGITATAMHILAERGLIEYDDAVARYWPEFGQHGKEAISIRHILSHTAGIAALPADTSIATHADFAAACRLVSQIRPTSRPSQIPEYHARTYGWTLAKVLRELVAGGLGLGSRGRDCARVADGSDPGVGLGGGVHASVEPGGAFLSSRPRSQAGVGGGLVVIEPSAARRRLGLHDLH